MTALSDDREGLRKKWERILESLSDMETVEGVGVAQERLRMQGRQKRRRKQTNLSRAGTVIAALAGAALAAGGYFAAGLAAAIAAGAGLFWTALNRKREAVFLRPELFLEAVGNAVLGAWQELDRVALADARVEVRRETSDAACFICLKNAGGREKSVFADTVAEFMKAIEDQRYLLRALEAGTDDRIFYPVPALFGKRKEDARIFAAHIASCIGPCDLIFTRSEEGRRTLVQAGAQDAAAGEEMNCAVRCKRVENR